jgi:hypothetical protein
MILVDLVRDSLGRSQEIKIIMLELRKYWVKIIGSFNLSYNSEQVDGQV